MLVIAFCSSGACGLSVVGDAREDAQASSDGGASTPLDGAIAREASAALDASGGADAETRDGCTVIQDQTVATAPSWWRILGLVSSQPGRVVLTSKAPSQTGAMWSASPITFTGTLRVELDYAIEPDEAPVGDGIAIAWIDVSTPPTLGPAGQSFGICNAARSGVAVAADSRDAQLLVMTGVSQNCATNEGVFPADVVGSTRLVAELRADAVAGRIGAGEMRSRPVTLPTTGYVGITASTGQGYAAHVIRAIRVLACP